MKKKFFLTGLILTLATSGFIVFLASRNVFKAPANATTVTDVTKKPVDVIPEVVYPVLLTVEQAGKIEVVVNKKHKLPETYVPVLNYVAGGQMRPEAAVELRKLLDDAAASGISLKNISAYRSYNTQNTTYSEWVAQYGQTKADTFSMRPGHSEHQTGFAIDLGNSDGNCALEICFGETPAGQWLEANAANYGFIIRYPEGKEANTGLQYEPWHLRFVGIDLAKKIVTSGKTLDQYFNIVAGDY